MPWEGQDGRGVVRSVDGRGVRGSARRPSPPSVADKTDGSSGEQRERRRLGCGSEEENGFLPARIPAPTRDLAQVVDARGLRKRPSGGRRQVV